GFAPVLVVPPVLTHTHTWSATDGLVSTLQQLPDLLGRRRLPPVGGRAALLRGRDHDPQGRLRRQGHDRQQRPDGRAGRLWPAERGHLGRRRILRGAIQRRWGQAGRRGRR